jgi:hypothetical protein
MGIGKQMSLVVLSQNLSLVSANESIEILPILLDGERTANGKILAALPHPLQGWAMHLNRYRLGIHTEPGGKHFGEHNQIAFSNAVQPSI